MILEIKSSYFPAKKYVLDNGPGVFLYHTEERHVFVSRSDDGSALAQLYLQDERLHLCPLTSGFNISRINNIFINNDVRVLNDDEFKINDSILRFEFEDNKIVLMIGLVYIKPKRPKVIKIVKHKSSPFSLNFKKGIIIGVAAFVLSFILGVIYFYQKKNITPATQEKVSSFQQTIDPPQTEVTLKEGKVNAKQDEEITAIASQLQEKKEPDSPLSGNGTAQQGITTTPEESSFHSKEPQNDSVAKGKTPTILNTEIKADALKDDNKQESAAGKLQHENDSVTLLPISKEQQPPQHDMQPSPAPSSRNKLKMEFIEKKNNFEKTLKGTRNRLIAEVWQMFWEPEPEEIANWTEDDYKQAVHAYEKLERDLSLALSTNELMNTQKEIFHKIEEMAFQQNLAKEKKLLLEGAKNKQLPYGTQIHSLDQNVKEILTQINVEKQKALDFEKKLGEHLLKGRQKYETRILDDIHELTSNWAKQQDAIYSVRMDMDVLIAFNDFIPKGIEIREQSELLTELYNRLSNGKKVERREMEEAFQKFGSLCDEVKSIKNLPEGIVNSLKSRLDYETKCHWEAMEVLNEKH